LKPAFYKDQRPAPWIAAGIVCALFVLSTVILSTVCAYGPRPTESLKHFNGAIDNSRQTYDLVKSQLAVRASEALKKGDAQTAEALYRELVAKYPDEADSYCSLGACLYFQKRYEEAQTNYLRALKLHPKSVRALYGLGSVAYEQDRNAEAKDYLEKALAFDPNNALCHRVLGCVLEQLGDPSQAITHYERAIALDPSVAGDAVIKERLKELKP
jgi:tetratricopeptide (TPR) repeat protein